MNALARLPVALSERSRPLRSGFACTVVSAAAAAVAACAPTDCRWPLGEVDDEAFRFCGAPRLRGSYCADHRRLSRQGSVR